MSKEIWRPGNMLYPLPSVLVTVADDEGNDNVLTVRGQERYAQTRQCFTFQ